MRLDPLAGSARCALALHMPGPIARRAFSADSESIVRGTSRPRLLSRGSSPRAPRTPRKRRARFIEDTPSPLALDAAPEKVRACDPLSIRNDLPAERTELTLGNSMGYAAGTPADGHDDEHRLPHRRDVLDGLRRCERRIFFRRVPLCAWRCRHDLHRRARFAPASVAPPRGTRPALLSRRALTTEEQPRNGTAL